MSKSPNPPAFPCASYQPCQGMMLRDWFAGQALGAAITRYPQDTDESIARESYAVADAMLKERAK